MKLPYRILLLEDDEPALEGMVELLRDAGYAVTPALTYDEAKRHLHEADFDLLVTDVRLRGFNGLHLVKQCRHDSPEMGVIIMTGYDESLMELEASRYQAQYIRKPIKPGEFLDRVGTCLATVRRQRRWPRKQVIGGFRVTAAGRPAAVMDVSYGGLRLQLPAMETVPHMFDVEVAGIGLHLQVEPVWSYPGSGGELICGAALASDTTPAAHTWRTIVDRLTA
jgi:DNA-binding response OmpR family regulator